MTTRPKQYSRRKTTAKKFGSQTKRNSNKLGYDKDWRIYRFRFLWHNKKCYVCASKSTVVDHYVAHKGDEDLFKDTSNHIPLCTKCHNIITGKFDSSNPPKTQEKHDWVLAKRADWGIDVKVVKLLKYVK